MFMFDPLYFLLTIPPLLLGMWAQAKVKSTFAEASRIPARMSGADAARRLLDAEGLYQVGIEHIGGTLSDHYDPRDKVLRLSDQVFAGNSMAAVGVAAHEAGHAIQDSRNYLPLVVRNAAVPAARFGGGISMTLIFAGILMSQLSVLGSFLVLAGIACFGGVVFFQVVNLPVEFDASARAKQRLVDLGITTDADRQYISMVLNAAAWTYVAATLQSVMTLIYFLLRFAGSRD